MKTTETKVNSSIRNCFKCEKEINRLELVEGSNFKPEQDNWDGAIVEKISGGYGSKHDCSVFIIAICDECIDKSMKTLEFLGNYTQGYKE